MKLRLGHGEKMGHIEEVLTTSLRIKSRIYYHPYLVSPTCDLETSVDAGIINFLRRSLGGFFAVAIQPRRLERPQEFISEPSNSRDLWVLCESSSSVKNCGVT